MLKLTSLIMFSLLVCNLPARAQEPEVVAQVDLRLVTPSRAGGVTTRTFELLSDGSALVTGEGRTDLINQTARFQSIFKYNGIVYLVGTEEQGAHVFMINPLKGASTKANGSPREPRRIGRPGFIFATAAFTVGPLMPHTWILYGAFKIGQWAFATPKPTAFVAEPTAIPALLFSMNGYNATKIDPASDWSAENIQLVGNSAADRSVRFVEVVRVASWTCEKDLGAPDKSL